ncbi:lycopene cyclase domain-containing protein [Ferruginibacter paludis]|uniref:lycopene cyclase domain-containing protein n=1 Tax=Ferruginibacter paludis TaxID=1310417 RepID=UPI0025B51A72|nr:lycopene cyclase domain-containing protein [Ferruginibacter paludis]MDN3658361.1 lycopene cyclase domain-containing protein [Ferruginibacter paludis]
MNNHYTYFLILGCSLAGPLALSFDKKVAFYKKWKYLFPAMLFPAFIYIAWDIFFTAKNVWSFNDNYITDIKLFNLPIEEVLFFFVVPYCCVFIYECIRCYFPLLSDKKQANILMQLLAATLLITGLIFYNRYYTSWAFILCALFIIKLFAFKKFFRDFNTNFFLIAYAVILIAFLLVNGFLTAIPVVLYNDAENLGIRIYTIPLEDIFYGMLLIMMNIALYEKLRNRKIETLVKQKI